MEVTKITVEPRTAKGRNQVLRLREEGKVPAVLYGQGKDPVNLAVAEREVDRHVRQHHKVFLLTMGGKEQAIFMQDVQWDCLTDRAVHLDFRRIDLNQPMKIVVELYYLGHAVGLGKGGRMVKDQIELAVECLPAAIPEQIEVKVSDLDVGDEITASQLELPEGCSLDVPDDTTICRVMMETPDAEEGEEGDEAAEGGES